MQANLLLKYDTLCHYKTRTNRWLSEISSAPPEAPPLGTDRATVKQKRRNLIVVQDAIRSTKLKFIELGGQ